MMKTHTHKKQGLPSDTASALGPKRKRQKNM